MSYVKLLLTEDCLNCPNIEVQTAIDKMYAADIPTLAYGYIRCKHIHTCEKVLDKSTITDILNKGR